MELERRVHAMLEDNELLQNTVDDLRERTLLLERQCHDKDLQVRSQTCCTSCESGHLLKVTGSLFLWMITYSAPSESVFVV